MKGNHKTPVVIKKKSLKREELLEPRVTRSMTKAKLDLEKYPLKLFNSGCQLLNPNHIIDSPITEESIDAQFVPEALSGKYLRQLDYISGWLWDSESGANVANFTNGSHQIVPLGIWKMPIHPLLFRTSATKTIFGQEFIEKFQRQGLWDRITNIVQDYFPLTIKQFCKLPQEYRLMSGFNLAVVNILSTSFPRCLEDDNFDLFVVVGLTNQRRGHLKFTLRDRNFILQQGDIMIFRSSQIWREIEQNLSNECHGARETLVLCLQKDLFNLFMDNHQKGLPTEIN